jgi:hypothetical protein
MVPGGLQRRDIGPNLSGLRGPSEKLCVIRAAAADLGWIGFVELGLSKQHVCRSLYCLVSRLTKPHFLCG